MRRALLVMGVVAWAPSAFAEDLATLRAELRDADASKAQEAANKIAEDTSPQSLDVIIDELSLGAPPKVQAELLSGLAKRKDARAFDTLAHFATNRNTLLRKKAVVAIGELTDMKSQPLLIAAMSDTVEEVRAAAAHALEARKDHSPQVEDALVKLLSHKDGAAVDALGALGGPGTARRLGELIGNIPDGLLANTFSEMLHRTDFGPDPLRLEVVTAIGRLTGPESTSALKEYVESTKDDKKRPSRLEAQKIIELRGAQ